MIPLLNKSNLIKLMFFVIICIFLIVLSRYHYILFHFSIELITGIIGYVMLIIVMNSLKISKNNPYAFLAISYPL